MAIFDFIDDRLFEQVYNNDIPMVNSESVLRICKTLSFSIKNQEGIYIYGDYDTDGFCSIGVWKEVLTYLNANIAGYFRYSSRTHALDKNILYQLNPAKVKTIIICDTGSGAGDAALLNLLRISGYTVIVVDHHVYFGDYVLESKHSLFFNSFHEKNNLDNCEVSGAYASLLLANVLCNKFFSKPVPYNAKVFALCSMYSDCVDMSSAYGRALYNAVAISDAKGPLMFRLFNTWGYSLSRRFFSFIVAPKLNGCFRLQKFTEINNLLSATHKELDAAVSSVITAYNEASTVTKNLLSYFKRIRFGEIVLCTCEVTEDLSVIGVRNFTGVIASRIASEEKSAVVVVVHEYNYYEGSFRDYYSRDLLDTFSLFSDCAGHTNAFKVGFSNLNEFTKYLSYLGEHLNLEYEKPYITLGSSLLESETDFDVLALYNEYANVIKRVNIAHTVRTANLKRSTRFSNYYDLGLAGSKVVMCKHTVLQGSTVLIEPTIARGVELREVE